MSDGQADASPSFFIGYFPPSSCGSGATTGEQLNGPRSTASVSGFFREPLRWPSCSASLLGNLPDRSFASGASAWASPIPVRRPRTEGSHAAHIRWRSSCCRHLSSSAYCPYPDDPGAHSAHQDFKNSLFASMIGKMWAERGYTAIIQGTRG